MERLGIESRMGEDAPPKTVIGGGATDLRALVSAIPVDKLRFLTAERYRAYSAILWTLLNHRRSHEIEVYYDDLMVEALGIVPTVEPGSYSPDAFRSDLKQLEDWGNLAPRRLEPRRIETLADRTLQKFLCRLDDETVSVLEFLAGRSRAAAAALTDRGRHLLRDAAERLAEALRLAQKLGCNEQETADATATGTRGDDLLRLAYLCLEVDRKVDDAARELAAFDAALVGFAVSPFRLETLGEVVDRLERYVEDYVAEATEHARSLHGTARKLLRPALSPVLLSCREHVERRLRDDPLVGGFGSQTSVQDVRSVVDALLPFFAPGGRFDFLLERVHNAARDVVRRVHRHVENVRARNIRIETLRDRSREMARLRDEDLEAANAWANGLYASAHLLTDLRCGTPSERSPLPRPARRYESRRAAHQEDFLPEKRGTPGQSRALERLRLLNLSRFVEEKILRGTRRASLSTAVFAGQEDFRCLLDAVKVHDLRAGRARRLLSYRIVHPGTDGARVGRARFALTDGWLDAPDLVFTKPGGRNG
jgi:hypothetical protein